MRSLLLLLLPFVAVADFGCPAYNAGNTISATQNYVPCSFQACGGQTLTIYKTACSGDTYIRLVDPSGNEIVSNDDSEGLCSRINNFVVPATYSCGTFTLRQGCFSGQSCSGQFAIQSTLAYGTCPTYTNEADCVSHKDERQGWRDQPCAWCCGGACTGNNGNTCEPQTWMLQQPVHVVLYHPAGAQNTCPALRYATCPGLTTRESCSTAKDERQGWRDQLCAWCCGAACTGNNGNTCEPLTWMLQQPVHVNNYKTGMVDSCNFDCVESYGAWGACSVTCGGGSGTQTRSRSVTQQQQGTGRACQNAVSQSCTSNTVCPVDCQVSYGAWGACSVTCGTATGTQTRSRTVTVAQAGSGAACSNDVSRSCTTNVVCAVDCVVSFGAWGSCSATCGTGTRTRTASVSTPQAGSGAACILTPTTQSCDTSVACPIWRYCADENGRCNVPTASIVRYGKNTVWTLTPNAVTGGIDCNNGVFGDPLVGTFKECQYRVDATQLVGVTASAGGFSTSASALAAATDGNIDPNTWTVAPNTDVGSCGEQRYLQLDLGGTYDVSAVQYWFYHGDVRNYCNQAVQTSADGASWASRYSCSDFDSCGVVSSSGRMVPTTGANGVRYVRWLSSRSNQNTGIHFIEIRVFGARVPVDCVVTFSAWSACSVSCGSGTQTRTATVTTPQAGTGAACVQTPISQACSTGTTCPVDCVVAFSAWGTCTATCGGGTQTRTATVTTPAAGNGAACITTPISQACNTVVCPVNCVVSFGAWSACSVTCGTTAGSQTRTATITTAQVGTGAACVLTPTTQSCSASTMTQLGLGCCRFTGWAANNQGYLTISDCTARCAADANCVAADVARPNSNNQYDCYNFRGNAADIHTECGTTTPTEQCYRKTVTPCPVDCAVSYSAWSTCSATCGAGTQTRTRTVTTPQAGTGLACSNDALSQSCTIVAVCPVDCVVSYGEWGACSVTCGTTPGTQTRSRSVVSEAQGTGAACTNDASRACVSAVVCPVDCAVTYGTWGACSVTCASGPGTQVRSLTVTTPQAGTGAACPGETSRPCTSAVVCPVNCVVSYADWSACTVTCGTSTGTQTRSRTVVTPQAGAGAACEDNTSRSCTSAVICPVNCVVSYSEWSACSVTCGSATGTQTRSQTVVTPQAGAGAACENITSRSCTSSAVCQVLAAGAAAGLSSGTLPPVTISGGPYVNPPSAPTSGNVAGRSAGAVPFGSGSLAGYCSTATGGSGVTSQTGIHCFQNINDGIYGNSNSWIPGVDNGFVGVRFGSSTTFDTIVVGRTNGGCCDDRFGGVNTIQVTTQQSVDNNTPASAWTTIGTFTRSNSGRYRYSLSAPVTATAIRLVVSDGQSDFDELEVYNSASNATRAGAAQTGATGTLPPAATADLCEYTSFQSGPSFTVYAHDAANTLCPTAADTSLVSGPSQHPPTQWASACSGIPVYDPENCRAVCANWNTAHPSGPRCAAFYTYYASATRTAYCRLLSSQAVVTGTDQGDNTSDRVDQFSGVPTETCQRSMASLFSLRGKVARTFLRTTRTLASNAAAVAAVTAAFAIVAALVVVKRRQAVPPAPATEMPLLTVTI